MLRLRDYARCSLRPRPGRPPSGPARTGSSGAASAEGVLAEREAEVGRLKEALEDQRLLTKEVCEASERQARDHSRESDLEEQLRRVRQEKETIQQDLARKAAEQENMMLQFAGAVAAAEKAMVLARNYEMLRVAKIADAINQKVELHISVPRVTLSYNNAPPLFVSVANGLGDDKIHTFLQTEVRSGDGASKKMYSTRMLDKLTDAIKAFIAKSQQADAGEGDGLKLVSSEKYAGSGAGTPETTQMRVSGSGSRGPASSDLESTIGAPGSTAPGTGASADGGAAGLEDADRRRLLDLLRSGDDRGLDDKLCELMKARSS